MKKILLIEDNKSISEEIATILQFEDYEVIEAENGLVGLALAIKEEPDLILCDFHMPQLNGIGLFKELNKDTVTASIPFIFLTASIVNKYLVCHNVAYDSYHFGKAE